MTCKTTPSLVHWTADRADMFLPRPLTLVIKNGLAMGVTAEATGVGREELGRKKGANILVISWRRKWFETEALCILPEVAICAALNANWLLLFGCWVHHLFWRKGKAKFPHMQLYRQIISPPQLFGCICLLSHALAIAGLSNFPPANTPIPISCHVLNPVRNPWLGHLIESPKTQWVFKKKKKNSHEDYWRERPVSCLWGGFQPVLAWYNAAG